MFIANDINASSAKTVCTPVAESGRGPGDDKKNELQHLGEEEKPLMYVPSPSSVSTNRKRTSLCFGD